jgi:hypothetical protein
MKLQISDLDSSCRQSADGEHKLENAKHSQEPNFPKL